VEKNLKKKRKNVASITSIKMFITSLLHAIAVTVTAGSSGVYMCDRNYIEVSSFYHRTLGLSKFEVT